MSLFQFQWLRRMLRRKTPHMPEQHAAIWKQRLAIGYMFVAWNAFGFVCYLMYTGRKDWSEYYGYKTEEEKHTPAAVQWAQTLKVDKAKIIRFSGLTKTEELDYEKADPTKSSSNSSEELPL